MEVAGLGKMALKEETNSSDVDSDVDIRISVSGKAIADSLFCATIKATNIGPGNIALKRAGGKASCTITGAGNILTGYFVPDVACRVTCSEDRLAHAKARRR
jgi:hypothetical protein